MAITFDATNSKYGGDNGGATSTKTDSIVIAGSNPFLLYWVQEQTTNTLTGITYNGVSLTRIGSATHVGSGRYNHLFYLATPTAGTHNGVVTLSGTGYIQTFIAIYNSSVGTIAIDSSATPTPNTSTTSFTSSTTVVAANCWLVMGGETDNGNNGPLNAGSGTTRRVNDTDFDSAAMFDSNGTVSTGSQSLIFTLSPAAGACSVIASIKETSPAVTITPGLGSELLTGQANILGFGIGMPDVP